MVKDWMIPSLRSGIREGCLFTPLLFNNCYGGSSQGKKLQKERKYMYPDRAGRRKTIPICWCHDLDIENAMEYTKNLWELTKYH